MLGKNIVILSSVFLALAQCKISKRSPISKIQDQETNELTEKEDAQTTIGDLNDKNVEYNTKGPGDNIYSPAEYFKSNKQKELDLYSSFLPSTHASSLMTNADATLSVPAIIARNGYDCETHTIVSQGYILNIHRIPRAKNSTRTSKPTVILFHCLCDTSNAWILNGPEKALGYVLADAGYDVWMMNARGNSYAREHAWYKTNTKEFWNFSFHELAQYDVPALIDYIQEIKGNNSKIAYLGYSLGTTVLFAMLTVRPEYNDKLTIGLSLAPSVFFSNTKFPYKKYKNNVIFSAIYAIRHGEYALLDKGITSKCVDAFGKPTVYCLKLIAEFGGEDIEQQNMTVVSNYMLKVSSISWKAVVHYIQMMDSGEFRQFDYGEPELNKLVYGQVTPPEYDLSKIKLNMSVFWGKNDNLINEKDVFLLSEKLSNTTQFHEIPYEKFTHGDFIWAKDAPTLLNDEVLKVLQESMKEPLQNSDEGGLVNTK